MQSCVQAFKGFTIIELIMVFVILGVLSAYAFPRFADMSSHAETTVIEGALTSTRASAGIAHAHWLASGRPESVTIDGLKVVTQNGYPTANVASNVSSDDDANNTLGLIPSYDNTICGLAGLSALDYQCQTDTANPMIVHITGLNASMGSACFRYQVPDSPDARPIFSRVLQSHNLNKLADTKGISEGWHTDTNTCQG